MNSTVTNLTKLAWSKLDNLSRLRKFIESELVHPHSFPPEVPLEVFQEKIEKIDHFVADFSQFLFVKRSRRKQPELLEEQFDRFSARYTELMEELENLYQP